MCRKADVHSCHSVGDSSLACWLQTELQSKDKAVADLRLWLDQAQGQLQNTQEALNQREGECYQLEADLTQAQAALEAAQASGTSRHVGWQPAPGSSDCLAGGW